MDKKAFAAALYNAYTTNKPLSKEEYTGKVTDYETAYAVQKEFAALKDEPTATRFRSPARKRKHSLTPRNLSTVPRLLLTF